ncbi:alpha/beta hydrolase family protein [Roseateles sp.]|jgi:predicted alpha/beta-hydrolase family hydrolase|uniref:alpha/beta hydrolase family protein n=1 Tax=Roseateles sp. TaxID=1971397 RepID=UPI0037C78616
MRLAVLAAATILVAAPAAADTTVVKADGTRLQVHVDLPAAKGRYPAIVLAPGQGYHMALPVMDGTARSLAAQGIAVFRFNWAYFSAEPKGQPSDELSRELGDMQTVIAAARQHPNVAADSVSVGGKSLGSVVAWRALAADARLRSALLLTPVCSRVRKGESSLRPEAEANYPGISSERRPTLWISGDKDPLCAPSVLYGFAATGSSAIRVAIVGGDHSYESRALAPVEAEAAHKRNLAAVSTLAASFLVEASSAQP